MALESRTIGSDARQYPDLPTWEAAIGAGAGGAGDDVVGVGYNDSVFTDEVVIDNADPDSITLTVHAAERHNGIEGTGCRLVPSSSVVPITSTVEPVTIEWWEVDQGEQTSSSNRMCLSLDGNHIVSHNILHGVLGTRITYGIHHTGGTLDCFDNFIYNITNANTGSRQCYGIGPGVLGTFNILNNTVHDVISNNGAGLANGIANLDDADTTVQNCMVTDTGGTSSGSLVDYNISAPSNATMNNNIASDTTASGAGSIDSVTSGNQYVSNSAPYDLHIKSGADAEGTFADLGTTPTGVNIDIDESDRDDLAVDWHCGAHQLLAAPGGNAPTSVFYGPLYGPLGGPVG